MKLKYCVTCIINNTVNSRFYDFILLEFQQKEKTKLIFDFVVFYIFQFYEKFQQKKSNTGGG